MLSIPPFVCGMLLGALLSVGIADFGPAQPLWTDGTLPGFFLVAALIAAALLAPIVLFVTCTVASGRVIGRPWTDAVALGMVVPIFGISLGECVHVRYGLTNANYRAEANGFLLDAVVSALLAITMPIVLVRGRRAIGPSGITGHFGRFLLAFTALPIAALVVAVVVQHVQARAFDRGCADLAAWVRMTYPSPATHAQLPLPGRFRSLASDHYTDAIVLPDGRVLLLLPTSFWGHDCSSGIVYLSGPVRPGEIGTDNYGRPQFTFPSLLECYIEKQIDTQHFIVAYDLG
jgi:hypothetical protein